MPCIYPWTGYRWPDGTVRKDPHSGPVRGLPMEMQCGRCIDCRIAQARDWSLRCHHESQMHLRNSFITLTFSDEGLEKREKEFGTPPSALDVRDWQKFARRMRKDAKIKFRYLHVGEYGEQNLRPHYHALIFGEDFGRDRCEGRDKNGNPIYRSPTLEKLWPHGMSTIKQMVPETINYCCRYVQKKLHGQRKQDALERVDTQTGEVISVPAEYATMSRRPGIGGNWWKEYKRDLFPGDFAIERGKKTRVPRFYFKKLQLENPEEAEEITKRRRKSAASRLDDRTPERRQVRKEILEARIKSKRTGQL